MKPLQTAPIDQRRDDADGDAPVGGRVVAPVTGGRPAHPDREAAACCAAELDAGDVAIVGGLAGAGAADRGEPAGGVPVDLAGDAHAESRPADPPIGAACCCGSTRRDAVR